MNDEILDAVYENDHLEDPRETAARAAEGANFESVYGGAIYHGARTELTAVSVRYDYSERERDAYWPKALARAIDTCATRGREHGVDGTPTEDEIKTARERSEHFLGAWTVVTGNDMEGGRLSAHQRLEIAKSVPSAFIAQARELNEEGICKFSNRAFELGQDLRRGERTRGDAQRGRDKAPATGRQRVRQQQRSRG
ncbi:hypothetical protein Q4543_23850 [Salipiger sp. 1_MG-2023]|uniref:hypothetical protein n=1 Tax=Salipiger sp. 1_MG-2023 TaxID=3062665 RepID=UPI0026E29C5C|nr:hypothetical protein [Salipiger sp. 1_MG-2023]MDO6588513.1 hypothetical protein [Salipiger sp. 1_MG-2023]